MADERFGGELRRFGREGAGEPLRVVSPFEPSGDQPQAIAKLAQGVEDGLALPDSHGRHGLGQDLYHGKDHRGLEQPDAHHGAEQDAWPRRSPPRCASSFPNNAVVYFVSLLRLLPARGLRPAAPTPTSRRTPPSTRRSRSCATRPPRACSSRRDVIVVASVSCIYGIGSPRGLRGHRAQRLARTTPLERDDLINVAHRHPVRPQRLRPARAGPSACGATRWTCSRPTPSNPLRVELLRRRGRAHRRGRRGHGRDSSASSTPFPSGRRRTT